MLDLFADGEPTALWTTDHNASCAETMDVTLGSVHLCIEQPGAAAVVGIGTGALVWQAGPALATALSEATTPPGFLRPATGRATPKRAIELGCGCSALPAVALALTGWQSVVASDASDVLAKLDANLAAYASSAAKAGVHTCLRDAVTPTPLQWDDHAALAAIANDRPGYDLVVGADVYYADILHEPLLDAVSACLAPTTESAVLLASAGRCARTLRLFFERVRARGFILTELSASLEPLPAVAPASAFSASASGECSALGRPHMHSPKLDDARLTRYCLQSQYCFWTKPARTSPLASGAAWSSFLTTHGTLRLGLDPLLFPVRALAALPSTAVPLASDCF